MPHYVSFEIFLSKIRNVRGGIRLCCRRFLGVLWPIIKHFMRLQSLISPANARRWSRPFFPTDTRTSSASAIAPQNYDLTSSESVRLPCYPSTSSSGATQPPTLMIEEPFTYGQPSTSPSSQAPSSSQTFDEGDRCDMQGVDMLQPMDFPHQLEPIRPDQLLRYDIKAPVSTEPAIYTVEPLQTDFCELTDYLPPGWVRLNCEGQPFFYHKEKKIITETWIYNREFWTEIATFIEMIEDWVKASQMPIPQNSELVVELRCPEGAQPGQYRCGYYFAHHETRLIFWLQTVCLDPCLVDIRGGQLAWEHVKLRLEYQYWKHFEMFETIQTVPAAVLNELRQNIIHAWTDVITCHLSTVNYSIQELGDMLKIVQEAIKGSDRGSPLMVGKFMSQFLNERFLNYYGQEAARLSRYQSIYGEPSSKDTRSWLGSIISVILFYAPDVHLNSLDKIWVDKIAAKQEWIKLISKLTSEWAEHTAFVIVALVLVAATILLNANVAFLDIPSVESTGTSQTLAQILSYISIVLVIGSAILGLLLVRQHRTKHIGTAAEAATFLTEHGLVTTAIIYSLPYALLMYGMILFLAAFLSSCFWSTTTTTRVTVGFFGPSYPR
ncbi:hypothetical protein B0H17DRAFT_1175927 [Mycena rosella]|uniref:WW domain-containing protein n=1 Tax=Mycena rosella TaxID=1033263 RepID=A0AAD7E245_MYCRO|nr:hypothetical protein B0H17DRAFT_1175927 [Mycena rosella]